MGFFTAIADKLQKTVIENSALQIFLELLSDLARFFPGLTNCTNFDTRCFLRTFPENRFAMATWADMTGNDSWTRYSKLQCKLKLFH